MRSVIGLILLFLLLVSGQKKQKELNPVSMFKASIDDAIMPNTTCFATGWGQTQGILPSLPNALQVVSLDIISKEVCEVDYEGYIQPGMICAGKHGSGCCSVSNNNQS